MGFIDKLKSGEFVQLCEINPPKGVEMNELYALADQLKGRIDAILITDMPSAVMRMGSLSASFLLKEKGLETIYNISCRDRNVLAMQSDLLGAAAFGLENLYITNGDAIQLGDHPKTRPVNEVNADEFISIVQRLREGVDFGGNKLINSPKFNMGTFINSNKEIQTLNIEDKIKQGASYFITPAVFDLNIFEDFVKKLKAKHKIPVIAEILILKSVATAKFINKHVDNVNVPESIIERLHSAGDKKLESIKITAELVKGLKNICDGVYIIPLGWESKIPEFLDAVNT